MTTNQTSSLIGMNNDMNATNMVNNISQFFTYEIRNLSLQLSTVNNTLSQKTNGLEEDFRAQKVELFVCVFFMPIKDKT